jgi:hypothetical protein
MAVAKKATKKVAVKKPRGTSVAAIKLGGEPRLLMPDNIQLVKALNWYNAVVTDSEQRLQWVLTFMDEQGHYSKEETAEFKRRGKKFLPTYSALARMISNGSTLDDKYTDTLNQQIATFIGKNALSDEDEVLDEEGQVITTTPVKSIKRDRTHALVCTLVEFIDGEMDQVLAGKKVGSLYEQLVRKNINAAAARDLKSFYKPQAFEFFELYKGKDAQLNEGYAHLSKPVRKAINDWLLQLVADLATLESNKKISRKPRKKRAVKVENLVKRVKYLKESTEFKVKSIDPANIIGAQSLWVFNTKTRQLGCYYAKDAAGLSIKGTTIVNGSGQMKKLRNPEAFLPSFTGTKASLNTKYTGIKAVAADMNGRLNEHTILLRVI